MKVRILTAIRIPHERRTYQRGEILNTLLGRAKTLCDAGVAEPAEPWRAGDVLFEDGEICTAPSNDFKEPEFQLEGE